MRFRITQTLTTEYEVEPENYPDGSSPEEMLQVDIDGASEDPAFFLWDADAETEVTGEIIDG